MDSAKLVRSTAEDARTCKRSLLVRAPGRNRTKGTHKNGLVRDAHCGLLDQMIPQADSRALMSEV